MNATIKAAINAARERGGHAMKFPLWPLAVVMGSVLAAQALAADAAVANSARPAADLIIQHARVWTVNPAQPEAQAVAVLGGRITAGGSDAAVLLWRGPRTRFVDAQGKRLLPGFNDAHVHFADGGASLTAVQLNDAASLAEFVKRVADYASHAPKGE